MEVSLGNIIRKIQFILNKTNPLLDRHGEKVAYLFIKMLKELNYTEQQIKDLCVISVLHDIGAYKIVGKNDTVRDILDFDLKSPHEHSVYGYLFMRNFAPQNLQDYATVILHHHFKYKDFETIDRNFMQESQLLYLADRAVILLDKYGEIDFNILTVNKNILFKAEYVDLLKSLEEKNALSQDILFGTYYDYIYNILDSIIVSDAVLDNFLNMIVAMIDFKSHYTMYHNITVTSIAKELSILSGLSLQDVTDVEKAAKIHDIGKVLTPVEILEKDGKLTDEEYVIMKRHIIEGRNILNGICDLEKIKLATTHHEKLDGTGYPDGLSKENLDFKQRVLVVADIVSALMGRRSYKEEFEKDKIISILREEVSKNKIDGNIVETFVQNYESILEKVNRDCKLSIEKYNIHTMEFDAIVQHMKKYNFM